MWIGLIFIGAVIFSFASEAIVVPRAPWCRTPLALALHILAVLFLCVFFMLLSARPVFSAFCAIALLAVMGMVSNPKFATLREPFVFLDLCLYMQIFRHPRLYLPFLGGRTIAAVGIGVAALVLGCWAEPPVTPHPWLIPLLVMAVCLAFSYSIAARLPLTLDATMDQSRHGFFAVFVAYLLNGLRPSTLKEFQAQVQAGPFASDGNGPGHTAQTVSSNPETAARTETRIAAGIPPDVIVIQSESYFDARCMSTAINPSVYAQFDRACRESVAWGELTVPAWGANTMRSEFSFLTGLASEQLGYARFYPYIFLRRACASLPGWFQRHGYHTLAIHPYDAGFFGRTRVFPLLHFERFLDIAYFKQAPRAGPYVADAAITEAIFAALENEPGQTPHFIFTMTMENHGPLYLETVRPGEAGLYHTLGEDEKWAELTIYLRHVANTDVMLGNLLGRLKSRSRPVVVCYYGDHVPSLPRQFRALSVMPQRSAYLIWRNFGARPSEQQNIRVEALGSMTLAAMQDTDRICPALARQ